MDECAHGYFRAVESCALCELTEERDVARQEVSLLQRQVFFHAGNCDVLGRERDAARAEVERLKVAVADLQALDHQHQQLLQPGFEILKRERDEARALVDLGVSLLLAADAPVAAAELARRRAWLQDATKEEGHDDEYGTGIA